MPSSAALDSSEPTEGKDGASHFFANKLGRIALLALEEVAGREGLRVILSSARMHDRLDDYPHNNFAPEFPFEELSAILRAMEELHGPRTGRRLARRMGRACFRIGAADMRPVLGAADLLFRILPLQMRFRIGFEVLAHVLTRFSDQVVELDEPSAAEHEGMLDDVLERPGITREVVLQQDPENLVRDPDHVLALHAVAARHDVLDEQRFLVVELDEDERNFIWITHRCGVCWGRTTEGPCCDLTVGLLEEALYWLGGGADFFIEESACIAAGDPTCIIRIGKHPLMVETATGD